jgi:hypothetical protein
MKYTEKQKRQHAFNGAWRGLKFQGFKPSRGFHGSLYRNKGQCCAIGWLIPNREYCKELEGKSVANPAVRSLIPLMARASRPFLQNLQAAHDISCSSREVRGALIDFADYYDLEIPDGDYSG